MLVSLLKELIELLQPLPLVWLSLLGFAWWLRRQGLRKPSMVALAIWLFMTITMCFPFGNRCLATIEQPWRSINQQWDSLPKGDAVVLLGGGVQPSIREIIGVNVQESSDRPTTAIELMRRKRAPLLVIGGGAPENHRTEAQAVAEWIESWNLTTAAVMGLGNCADTHDEALKTSELAKKHGWKRILLVTSASHMNRAAAVFRKTTGIEVVPVPCSFITKKNVTQWVQWPETGQLLDYGVWFHEVVGTLAYQLRGWI